MGTDRRTNSHVLRVRDWCVKIRQDCRGQALVMFTVMFAVFLGFLGIVFDGGRLYFEKRSMQVAADAAAIAGAHELLRGNDAIGGANWVRDAARDDATLNGYNNAASDIDVQVTHPAPVYGNTHVEVIITRTVPTTFARVFEPGPSTVRARAIAGIEPDMGPPCILALNPTASGALTASGGAVLNAPTCNILVNSNDTGAINTNGGGCITGKQIGFVQPGSYVANGQACANPSPLGRAIPTYDYYKNMAAPSAVSQTVQSTGKLTITTGNASTYSPLQPGYYAGGIQINGGNVVLSGGLYVVDGFSATGGQITGAGVTIYNTANGLKNIFIGGNVQADLRAPTGGDYKNILFFNSRSAPDTNPYAATVIGTSTAVFEGAHYFPTVAYNFGGNQAANAPWAMIIADTISLAGTPNLNVEFGPTSGRTPDMMRVALVE